ncbi:MAG: zinc-binding dehydrogenase, partial [Devosia sp.]
RALLGVATIAAGESAAAAASEITDGDGFDIVFDATGNRNSMNAGFDFVANGGRFVFVSVVKGPITFEDADFHRKEMTLFGSRNATSVDFERVIGAIRDKLVPIDRIITHRTSLADAATNIPIWATQKHGLIKALVTLGD